MTTLDTSVFVALLLIFPLPLLALFGSIAQRRRLAEERRRFAVLRRIASGNRLKRF